MLQNQKQKQQIYVTCLVQHDNRVLLVRNSQCLDYADHVSAGYFGLPRFTLTLGSNPVALIKHELEKQFNQKVKKVSVLNIIESMVDSVTQTVELIYRVEIKDAKRAQVGHFCFVSTNQLSNFVFPKELLLLEKLLEE